MVKYLYGAEVQGIQNFILESNKLREIAGGSEYVEQICTTKFQEILGNSFKIDNLIQGAAGIVRYLFDDSGLHDCEKVIKEFPFSIQKDAPGITISQAVIKIDDGNLNADHISDLILKLDAQRNNIQLSFQTALMIVKRSPLNGQGAISLDHKKYLSQHQVLKERLIKESDTLANKIGLKKESLPFGDLVEITGNGENRDQWIAIIHADGNSMGKLIIRANRELQMKNGNVKEFYSTFSRKLNLATIEAAKTAVQCVLASEIKELNNNTNKKIPIRPVLIGGDDMAVIIKAEYALEYSRKFMEEFEEKTKNLVYDQVLKNYGDFSDFSNGLTTCVGIAYIKPNYPFHYAVNLAEQLCKAAKDESKKVNENCAPSSLMFHQVHSSFVGKWDDIVKRELTVSKGNFVGGPYYLNTQDGRKTIENIQKWSAELNRTEKDGSRTSLKSQIRSLITEYIDNPNGAEQYEKRLRKVNSTSVFKSIGLEGECIFNNDTSHAWDIIKIATIAQKRKS